MTRIRWAAAALAALACRPAPSKAPSPAATDAGLRSAIVRPPAVYEGDRVKPAFPAAWQYKAGYAATFGEHAMVSSDAPLASEAGAEILRRGGNAVDAAVATAFALAVTYPEAGNIGGGGYMLIRMADGRMATLDFREVAPLAATRDMFLDASGMLTDRSVVGALASGVPGSVAGLTSALARFGTLPLATVMAPAIRYAEEGFVVDSSFAHSIATNRALISRFAGAKLLLADGKPLAAGTVLRQPALAATLRRIAERGADGFYKGETARAIAEQMRRDGGIITEQDLASYKPVWREPVASHYRGYTLLTMPPSSSGGVTITETLNILEGYAAPGSFGSATWVHRLGSSFQRAFIDRNEKIADPAFYSVPVARLTSKEYAAKLRATIPDDRATPTAQLAPTQASLREGSETTHSSVVDAQGNAVATTTTLNFLYGSGVYVEGAGFFLNDEMDDFAAKPGTANGFGLVQGEANAVQPGKRMLSAMSPTIVLDSAGRVLLVVGARGGPRIIASTAQVILNVLDHHMILSDAVSAPRIHHQALPDTIFYERTGLLEATIDSLRAMGHAVAPFPSNIGSINAIMRVRNGWEGMPDPRLTGKAVGW